MAYIYKITDTRNDLAYIGKHNGSATNYFCSGIIVNNIAKVHGRDILKREIVVEGDFNSELLNELEKHYIRLYNTKKPYGYNLTDGGDGNSGFTQETLDKISKGNKGKKKHSEEWKAEASVRRIKSNKERVFTPELLKKMSDSHIGKNTGKDSGISDKNVYKFVHENGDEFIGIRCDFLKKYNFSSPLNSLISGRRVSYFGWYLNFVKSPKLKKPGVKTEDIIRDYKSGIKPKEISKKYNISVVTVFNRLKY